MYMISLIEQWRPNWHGHGHGQRHGQRHGQHHGQRHGQRHGGVAACDAEDPAWDAEEGVGGSWGSS